MAKTQQNATSQRARPWQKAFLLILAESGIVTTACEAVDIDRATAYRRREADPDFAAAWDRALDDAADRLEAEVRRRAVEGWDEPVFGRVAKDQDGQIGLVRKYSDSLAALLLKGAKPEKYRDRQQVEHSGKIDVTRLSDDQLRAILES